MLKMTSHEDWKPPSFSISLEAYDFESCADEIVTVARSLRARGLRAQDRDTAKELITWKFYSRLGRSIYLKSVITKFSDKELSKLITSIYLCLSTDVRDSKDEIIFLLLEQMKLVSLQRFMLDTNIVSLKGRFLAKYLDKHGLESYWDLRKKLDIAEIEISRPSHVFTANHFASNSPDHIREIALEHIHRNLSLSSTKFDDSYVSGFRDLTLQDLQSEDWIEKIFIPPLYFERRMLLDLVSSLSLDNTDEVRDAIFAIFEGQGPNEFSSSLMFAIPFFPKNSEARDLLLDIFDLYFTKTKQLSFSQGIVFCLLAKDYLTRSEVLNYLDDLEFEVVKQREKFVFGLPPITQLSVPAITNKYDLKDHFEVMFLLQMIDRYSHSDLTDVFLIRYLESWNPSSLVGLSRTTVSEIESHLQAVRQSVLIHNLARIASQEEWVAYMNSCAKKGVAIRARDWSTGVDFAEKSGDHDFFKWVQAGYRTAVDMEPEYFLFNEVRYNCIWGSFRDISSAIVTYLELADESRISQVEKLPEWVMLQLIRHCKDSWLAQIPEIIEEYYFLQRGVPTRLLSALCERHRSNEDPTSIESIIDRFGSRLLGNGDYVLLVLAACYYDVGDLQKGYEELVRISKPPIDSRVRQKAITYATRYRDSRIRDLFSASP